MCVAGEARAQGVDGPRVRGGIGVDVGGMLVPGIGNYAAFDVLRGELGVQLDDRWGVYVEPSLGMVLGTDIGMTFGAAALVDYTFDAAPISLGLGPEVQYLACFTCDTSPGSTDIGGTLFGGRARFAFHPVVARRPGARTRHAVTLGVDLRVDGRASSFVAYDLMGKLAATSPVAVSPMGWIGYTAF
jgi:hypothetical protein